MSQPGLIGTAARNAFARPDVAIAAGLAGVGTVGNVKAAYDYAAEGDYENAIKAGLGAVASGYMLYAGCKALSTSTTSNKATILQQNKAKGAAFERTRFAAFKAKYSNAETQITIKIGDTRTRLDAIAVGPDGKTYIEEYKSSQTAPLTRNQSEIFEALKTKDAVVVGGGKGIFTKGVVIPAGTPVTVVRPTP